MEVWSKIATSKGYTMALDGLQRMSRVLPK